MSDIIAAISTAMSPSGIGIIRMSGDRSLQILERIFVPFNKKLDVGKLKSHTVTYGYIYDGDVKIDEVLVIYMKAPHSYTTEDTVEIDCHGGVFVQKKVLETVVKNGARLAGPGEFTKRAFLNGRIDLSQSEAVIELIDSKNEYSRKNALNKLGGGLSDKISKIRDDILYETAYIESALDDPEHISLDGYSTHLLPKLDEWKDEIDRLAASFDNGRIVNEGINTVIIGRPNVGKSSLLNLLLGEERAIVTDIAGTTRDTLEESISLNGIVLNMTDTAGIREAGDNIEKIGISRAQEKAKNADLILYVIDSSQQLTQDDLLIMDMIKDKRVIIIFNKTDLPALITPEDVTCRLGKPIVNFSAKEKKGEEELFGVITDMFLSGSLDLDDQVLITSERQKYDLICAGESLENVRECIDDGLPEDFYTIDLMDAYTALGRILGESLDEDLIDSIFENFCMGK